MIQTFIYHGGLENKKKYIYIYSLGFYWSEFLPVGFWCIRNHSVTVRALLRFWTTPTRRLNAVTLWVCCFSKMSFTGQLQYHSTARRSSWPLIILGLYILECRTFFILVKERGKKWFIRFDKMQCYKPESITPQPTTPHGNTSEFVYWLI